MAFGACEGANQRRTANARIIVVIIKIIYKEMLKYVEIASSSHASIEIIYGEEIAHGVAAASSSLGP